MADQPWEVWYLEKVSQARDQALSIFLKEGRAQLYLWFKKGSAVVAREQPEGYELATNEPLPYREVADTEWLKGFLWEWINLRLRSVPILPDEVMK